MKVARAALLVTALALTIAVAGRPRRPHPRTSRSPSSSDTAGRAPSPAARSTDEHCFSWVYGDKFVRDQHVVHRGDGKPGRSGRVDLPVGCGRPGAAVPVHRERRAASAAARSPPRAGRWYFPRRTTRRAACEQIYRSRWQRAGRGRVRRGHRVPGQGRSWTPGFTLHMRQVQLRSGSLGGQGSERCARAAPGARGPRAPRPGAATPGGAPACSCRTATRSGRRPAPRCGCARRRPGLSSTTSSEARRRGVGDHLHAQLRLAIGRAAAHAACRRPGRSPGRGSRRRSSRAGACRRRGPASACSIVWRMPISST